MSIKPLFATTMVAIALSGCQTIGIQQPISTEDGIRQVNQVRWDKTGDSFSLADDSELATDQSRLIFVRKLDQDDLQTSINVGIDDRFQVSIQPGQFSEVVTCSGNHSINTELTGTKNNKLSYGVNNVNLTPQSTHYFEIDVDDSDNLPSLRQLSEDQALTLLNDSVRQTHQISRVIPDCLIETPTQPPIITTEPEQKEPIEINTPIKLDVLFDFDSARIKPNYYQRLESMAEFMKANTNMTAILEGHTDSKGPASYNLRLSQARANAVKTFLVNKYGTDATRLNTVGYGESRPVDTNSTVQGRQNNRRVVAIINQDQSN